MSATKRALGHPRYLAILDEMKALHLRKDSDYAGESKPFDNFRSALDIGVKPSTGAFIRLQDKFKRIQNLLLQEGRGQGPAVRNESIEDTLLDLSAYALIVLVLREEERDPKTFPIRTVEDLERLQRKSDSKNDQ